MNNKVVVSLLSIQLTQLKFSYFEIGNLNTSNVVQLLKFNTNGTKCQYNILELLIIWKGI